MIKMSPSLTRTPSLTAVAAVLIAFGSLSAQEPRFSAIRDDATRSVVMEQLTLAKSSGLPVEPLMSKALEGVAKNASTASIRKAMDALQGRLHQAKDLLSPTVSVDELAAGGRVREIRLGSTGHRGGGSPSSGPICPGQRVT